MLKKLEKLGFTPNETKIYSVLLNLGQSSTGPIIKKIGLHRNIVYDALDNLVKKKLISEVVKSGKKYFKVRNPQILVNQAQEQLNLTNKIAEQIKGKMKSSAAPEVIVYEGSEGWQSAHRNLFITLKPKKDKICTLGVGGDKWIKAMRELFIPYEQFMVKNKIKLNMIAYEWQRAEIIAHQSNLMRTTRYLSQKYPMPANTEIFKDRIFIQIYSEPVILIEVRSKEVAKGYQQHFDVLWKLASN